MQAPVKKMSEGLDPVYKLDIYINVIPLLDRGIQYFQYVLDCPVKPDNDK